MVNVKSDESDAEKSKQQHIQAKKNKDQRRAKSNQSQIVPVEEAQVDKFLEEEKEEGIELGKICKHFSKDGDLIFLVNLNKGDLIYGTVQMTSGMLRSICEEKMIEYMEKCVRKNLIVKKSKEGGDNNEFWDKID